MPDVSPYLSLQTQGIETRMNEIYKSGWAQRDGCGHDKGPGGSINLSQRHHVGTYCIPKGIVAVDGDQKTTTITALLQRGNLSEEIAIDQAAEHLPQ